MSNFIKLNNKFFAKGFFYWFGIEAPPFSSHVDKYVATKPHIAIKKDLSEIRKSYRKSYSQLKEMVNEIE